MISQLQQQLQHQHRHHHTYDTTDNKTNLPQFCVNLPEFNSVHSLLEYDAHIDDNDQRSIGQGRLITNNDNISSIDNRDIRPKSCTTVSLNNTIIIDDNINSSENSKHGSVTINHQFLSKKNQQLTDYNKSISPNSGLQHELCYSPNTTCITGTTSKKCSIEFNSEKYYNNSKYPSLHNSSLSKANNQHLNNDSNNDDNGRNLLQQTDNRGETYKFQKDVKQITDYEKINNHLKNEYILVDQQPLLSQSSLLTSLPSSTCSLSLNKKEYIRSSLKKDETLLEDNESRQLHNDNLNEEKSSDQDDIGGLSEGRRSNNHKIDECMLDSLNFRLGRTIEKMDVLHHLQKFSKY
ncbi:hypothetical protein EWB00_010711 [Schistosoma japonicum]|uniref:Uncharacterized protein n=1 Tax=Schistosoma japonicum TaxID=6182 RepID=A0A4Z2DNT6_SCHJA|nr:hypothetical protein EWB00_010711 [Schistosoma japonicum]